MQYIVTWKNDLFLVQLESAPTSDALELMASDLAVQMTDDPAEAVVIAQDLLMQMTA